MLSSSMKLGPGQEKGGDKTEDGEMTQVHTGGIAWQQTAQDEMENC